MMLQNVMTSEVLQNHLEATYITVDSVCFFGVKQKPSLVVVNSQGVPFTYRENQVSGRMNRWIENDWTTPQIPDQRSLRWHKAVVFKVGVAREFGGVVQMGGPPVKGFSSLPLSAGVDGFQSRSQPQ